MIEDRAVTLLRAAEQLLETQNSSGIVLNLLTETVFYDGANCDGYCLLNDISVYLDDVQPGRKEKKMTREQMERYLASFDEDEEVDLTQEALNRFLNDEQEHAEALREELTERALDSPGCAQEDIIEMYRKEF